MPEVGSASDVSDALGDGERAAVEVWRVDVSSVNSGVS